MYDDGFGTGVECSDGTWPQPQSTRRIEYISGYLGRSTSFSRASLVPSRWRFLTHCWTGASHLAVATGFRERQWVGLPVRAIRYAHWHSFDPRHFLSDSIHTQLPSKLDGSLSSFGWAQKLPLLALHLSDSGGPGRRLVPHDSCCAMYSMYLHIYICMYLE